ncbi:MAG: hypothetical protein KIH63_002215 [Candidatus Saccharibacteria bacterium]|nr:hypothetical protein [Candidatus Saccharibacteria bacterium]
MSDIEGAAPIPHDPYANPPEGLPDSLVALWTGRSKEVPDADAEAAIANFATAAEHQFDTFGDAFQGNTVLYGRTPDPDVPGRSGDVIATRRIGPDGTYVYDYQTQFRSTGSGTEVRTYLINPTNNGQPTKAITLALYPRRLYIYGIQDPSVIDGLTASLGSLKGIEGPKKPGKVSKLLGRIGLK